MAKAESHKRRDNNDKHLIVALCDLINKLVQQIIGCVATIIQIGNFRPCILWHSLKQMEI